MANSPEQGEQALPPPLSTRLAGMSMSPFLAQELDDFDNAATPLTQPAATPSAYPPAPGSGSTRDFANAPGFGPGFSAETPPSVKKAEKVVDPVEVARKKRAKAARALERQDPFRLSHVMRAMLFVFGEQLAFAPDSETGRFLPHMQGADSETLITALFRKYADDDGFIHRDGWTTCLEDLDIISTHVARDASGRVVELQKEKDLSPDALFAQCSKLPGNSKDPNTAPGRPKALSKERHMDFPLFYRALLMTSKAALPDVYENQPAAAFNEILTTSVTSAYSWGPNRARVGTSDELLKDVRIALLMRAYMPNLWRVFLYYATDVEGNSPQGNYSFPAYAQGTEQVLSCFRDINQSRSAPLRTFLMWEENERTERHPGAEHADMNAPTYVDCNDGGGFCIFLEALARLALKGLSSREYATLYATPYEKVMALLCVWGVADPARLEQVLHLNGGQKLPFTTETSTQLGSDLESLPSSPQTAAAAAATTTSPQVTRGGATVVELMVTETAWARFVENFSLAPAVVPKSAAVALFRRTLMPHEAAAAQQSTQMTSPGFGDSVASERAPDNVTLHSRSITHAKEAEKKRSQLRLSGKANDSMNVQFDVTSTDIVDLVGILNEQRTQFSSLTSTVEEELSVAHPDLDQEGIDEIVLDSLNEHVGQDFDRNEELKEVMHSAGIDVRHPHVVHTVLREPTDLPRKGDPQARDEVLMLRIPGRHIEGRLYIKGLDAALIDQAAILKIESSLSKTIKGITAACVKVLSPVERVEIAPDTGKPVGMKTSLVAFRIDVPPGQSMFKIAGSMRRPEYATLLLKHVRANNENVRSLQRVVGVRLEGVERGPGSNDTIADVQTVGLTQIALTTSWEVPEDEFAEIFSSIAIYDKMCELQGFVHRSSKGAGPIKYYQTHEHEDHENDALSVHEMFSLDLDALPESAFYLFHILSSERGLQEVLSPSVELFDMHNKEMGALGRINLYNTHLYEGHAPGSEGTPQSLVTCMIARVSDKASAFRNGWKLEFFGLRTQGTTLQNSLGIKRSISEALRYRTRSEGLKVKSKAASRNSTADGQKEAHLLRGGARIFAAAAAEWYRHEVHYVDGTLGLEHFMERVENKLHPKVTAHMNQAKANRDKKDGVDSGAAAAAAAAGGADRKRTGARAGGGGAGGAALDDEVASEAGVSIASGSSMATGLMADAISKWFNDALEKARTTATADPTSIRARLRRRSNYS